MTHSSPDSRPAASHADVDVQVTSTLSGPTARRHPTSTSRRSSSRCTALAISTRSPPSSRSSTSSAPSTSHPAGVPLGSFHTGRRTFSLPHLYPQDVFGRLAFAEVYWAKIPRTVVDDQHMLEETKKWARTDHRAAAASLAGEGLEGWLRGRGLSAGPAGALRDDRHGRRARPDLLHRREGRPVHVRPAEAARRLPRRRADRHRVRSNRTEILDAFDDVLTEAHKAYPRADIYLVAHSEGTVVSFLGLLNAFRAEERPAWRTRSVV